jgi:hypothetical protein
MPGHEKRWCKYHIEYDTAPPSGPIWDKTFCREVTSDQDIKDFKNDAVGQLQLVYADALPTRTSFQDWIASQPTDAKAI